MSLDEFAETEFIEAARGVDQHIAVALETREHVDLVQQRGVLDDQCVRLHDRFAQPDFAVGDAAERYHRRTGAFGAETGEGLRMMAFAEGRHRQHFCGGDHALAAAAMNSHLEHWVLPGLCWWWNFTP
jgi:hypothetical protein